LTNVLIEKIGKLIITSHHYCTRRVWRYQRSNQNL